MVGTGKGPESNPESKPMTELFSSDDGKYRIIRQGRRVVALRHGERWRELTGDNLIAVLLERIEKLSKPDA